MNPRPTTYDLVSRLNHWIVAILFLFVLGLGIYIFRVLPSDAPKGPLIGQHKALGVIVLILASWRILWRVRQGMPEEVGDASALQAFLAKAVHGVLFLGTVLMPLSGAAGSYFGGPPTNVFGLFTIPAGPKVEWINSLSYGVHGVLAFAMIAAVGLHVAGALKHHFVDRDTTLLRMLGRA
jgi:cytochrome b561